MRVRGLRGWAMAVASLGCLALLAPGGAGAATVVNGDFESGTLKGWSVHRATTFGNWFAYKGAGEPIANKRPGQPIQSPPLGNYAAIADQLNADTLILSQDVALEPGTTHFLSLLAYYTSYAPIAVPTPETLSVDEAQLGEQANQQFRIDVLRPGAPLESLDPADLLATVFRTQPGAAQQMGPSLRTVDLSAFAGQTVRLRIAVAASKEVMAAGVDAVTIAARPPDPRSLDLNPRRFRLGKAMANPRNGTVTLLAEVPSAGLLTARSATGSGAKASASKAGKAPRLIKPARRKASAPGTVKLLLKPTSAALAALRKHGRLRARVAVAFGEGAAKTTLTKAVVFRLAARPSRR
jgi:hypothetical protein